MNKENSIESTILTTENLQTLSDEENFNENEKIIIPNYFQFEGNSVRRNIDYRKYINNFKTKKLIEIYDPFSLYNNPIKESCSDTNSSSNSNTNSESEYETENKNKNISSAAKKKQKKKQIEINFKKNLLISKKNSKYPSNQLLSKKSFDSETAEFIRDFIFSSFSFRNYLNFYLDEINYLIHLEKTIPFLFLETFPKFKILKNLENNLSHNYFLLEGNVDVINAKSTKVEFTLQDYLLFLAFLKKNKQEKLLKIAIEANKEDNNNFNKVTNLADKNNMKNFDKENLDIFEEKKKDKKENVNKLLNNLQNNSTNENKNFCENQVNQFIEIKKDIKKQYKKFLIETLRKYKESRERNIALQNEKISAEYIMNVTNKENKDNHKEKENPFINIKDNNTNNDLYSINNNNINNNEISPTKKSTNFKKTKNLKISLDNESIFSKENSNFNNNNEINININNEIHTQNSFFSSSQNEAYFKKLTKTKSAEIDEILKNLDNEKNEKNNKFIFDEKNLNLIKLCLFDNFVNYNSNLKKVCDKDYYFNLINNFYVLNCRNPNKPRIITVKILINNCLCELNFSKKNENNLNFIKKKLAKFRKIYFKLDLDKLDKKIFKDFSEEKNINNDNDNDIAKKFNSTKSVFRFCDCRSKGFNNNVNIMFEIFKKTEEKVPECLHSEIEGVEDKEIVQLRSLKNCKGRKFIMKFNLDNPEISGIFNYPYLDNRIFFSNNNNNNNGNGKSNGNENGSENNDANNAYLLTYNSDELNSDSESQSFSQENKSNKSNNNNPKDNINNNYHSSEEDNNKNNENKDTNKIQKILRKAGGKDILKKYQYNAFVFSLIKIMKKGENLFNLNEKYKHDPILVTKSECTFLKIAKNVFEEKQEEITKMKLNNILLFFMNSPFFKEMSKLNFYKMFFKFLGKKKFSKFDKICNENDEVDDLYFIKEGSFIIKIKKSILEINDIIKKLTNSRECFNEENEINKISEDDKFAEFAKKKFEYRLSLVNTNDILFFDEYLIDKKSFFTVECSSQTADVFTLDKKLVKSVLDKFPKVKRKKIKYAESKKESLINRLMDLKISKINEFVRNDEVGLTLKDYNKEKESRLEVFSMNFRKEVEEEHGEEIQKKLLNPTKFVKLKRKSKKVTNLIGNEKEENNVRANKSNTKQRINNNKNNNNNSINNNKNIQNQEDNNNNIEANININNYDSDNNNNNSNSKYISDNNNKSQEDIYEKKLKLNILPPNGVNITKINNEENKDKNFLNLDYQKKPNISSDKSSSESFIDNKHKKHLSTNTKFFCNEINNKNKKTQSSKKQKLIKSSGNIIKINNNNNNINEKSENFRNSNKQKMNFSSSYNNSTKFNITNNKLSKENYYSQQENSNLINIYINPNNININSNVYGINNKNNNNSPQRSGSPNLINENRFIHHMIREMKISLGLEDLAQNLQTKKITFNNLKALKEKEREREKKLFYNASNNINSKSVDNFTQKNPITEKSYKESKPNVNNNNNQEKIIVYPKKRLIYNKKILNNNNSNLDSIKNNNNSTSNILINNSNSYNNFNDNNNSENFNNNNNPIYKNQKNPRNSKYKNNNNSSLINSSEEKDYVGKIYKKSFNFNPDITIENMTIHSKTNHKSNLFVSTYTKNMIFDKFQNQNSLNLINTKVLETDFSNNLVPIKNKKMEKNFSLQKKNEKKLINNNQSLGKLSFNSKINSEKGQLINEDKSSLLTNFDDNRNYEEEINNLEFETENTKGNMKIKSKSERFFDLKDKNKENKGNNKDKENKDILKVVTKDKNILNQDRQNSIVLTNDKMMEMGVQTMYHNSTDNSNVINLNYMYLDEGDNNSDYNNFNVVNSSSGYSPSRRKNNNNNKIKEKEKEEVFKNKTSGSFKLPKIIGK